MASHAEPPSRVATSWETNPQILSSRNVHFAAKRDCTISYLALGETVELECGDVSICCALTGIGKAAESITMGRRDLPMGVMSGPCFLHLVFVPALRASVKAA